MTTSSETIIVTGAKGQLGNAFKEEVEKITGFPYFFIFTDVDELDICNTEQVDNTFQIHKPKYLINCAAYTAVDKAEEDVQNAYKLNEQGPEVLSQVCKKYGTKLIHISTDYVFDGNAHIPYKEDAQVNPQSIYGKSKLAGEEKVLASGVGMIIRTSWLYSTTGNNFVKTIIRNAEAKPKLNVVFDQIGTPTYANDLAKAILAIISKEQENFKPEIFHFSNEGVCSWYDFAEEIVRLGNFNCKIIPIESSEFPSKVKRPYYSVLNKKKIRNTYNVETPFWIDSLLDCITRLI
ncbi:MAG: dTDP-4-dehydrorhamnose reductase [Bacteroidales bacterium]|nr:dTDP-4-dehydrorhamnose reductase [Bacteroidales bacterium]